MRQARLVEPGEACYHVMSRVVDRRFILNDDEKERFRRLLRRVEGFSGVEVLTFAVLDNHFHALLRVPERRDIDDTEWVQRPRAQIPRLTSLSLDPSLLVCPLSLHVKRGAPWKASA